MKSKDEIDSAMVHAYQAGYDIVFLQVRGRGDAFYDSKIVSKNHLIKSDFDPKIIIRQVDPSEGDNDNSSLNTADMMLGN